MDKLKVALQALKEIREDKKDCEKCSGDCTFCYDGTSAPFELADKAIKRIEKDIPAIDLNNRILEVIIKAHLPGEIQTNSEDGGIGLYDKANTFIYGKIEMR